MIRWWNSLLPDHRLMLSVFGFVFFSWLGFLLVILAFMIADALWRTP